MPDTNAPAIVRLDLWLDIACLFRTRSEAQRACRGGKVAVNGHSAKPNRAVRQGDELEITRGSGPSQRIVVRELADRHVRKADARRLYDDVTPPPSAEEIELRRLERVFRTTVTPQRSPDKRARRELRRLRGRQN